MRDGCPHNRHTSISKVPGVSRIECIAICIGKEIDRLHTGAGLIEDDVCVTLSVGIGVGCR